MTKMRNSVSSLWSLLRVYRLRSSRSSIFQAFSVFLRPKWGAKFESNNYKMSSKSTITPNSYEGADAYVTSSFDHLLGMAQETVSFDKLFLDGLLNVEGNLSKGAEIRQLLCRFHTMINA